MRRRSSSSRKFCRAIPYDDPLALKTYLLVARNALFIPSMDHNLIAPIIMREAGLKVNEEAKRSADVPTIEHHSIYDDESDLRIHLQLKGIFSYFQTRKLTNVEMENWDHWLYMCNCGA